MVRFFLNNYFIYKGFLFALLILIIGCKSYGDENKKTQEKDNSTQSEQYSNGTFCANVAYYNPNTGTQKTYTLNVEVEDNELVKIYWSNGGWLDESHFTPPAIEDDGTCRFTSDKGNRYDIEIIGSKCSGTGNNPEPDYTIADCAAEIGLTESELQAYEKDFDASRNDPYTEKMCQSLYEYFVKLRDFDNETRRLQAFMENGFIEKITRKIQGGEVLYHYAIVKKFGVYFLMEIDENEILPTGNMTFNHELSGWQNVAIQHDRNSDATTSHLARIVSIKESKLLLEFELDEIKEKFDY